VVNSDSGGSGTYYTPSLAPAPARVALRSRRESRKHDIILSLICLSRASAPIFCSKLPELPELLGHAIRKVF